ncbi:MAG: hypothetical protein K940chlam9_01683, partial [Chlamydiae bacterium]|nr:hypothetical protein [Chlamydiota bacterium]
MEGGLRDLIESFLETAFVEVASLRTYADPLEEVICGEFTEICNAFEKSHLQESSSWRSVYQARRLASILIDEKGELDISLTKKSLRFLEENFYSLGPNRFHDTPRLLHVKRILRSFAEERAFVLALKRIYAPHENSPIQKLIRETLLLTDGTLITHSHARQAAFSALLTYLRQNVGSCFATAPAIMIQQEQPLQFLEDMGQLFGTGRLTRTIEGNEYAVPFSPHWGMGDLLKPLPLYLFGENPYDLLALSPGLQAAFVAAGLIKSKSAKLSARCLKKYLNLEEKDPFSMLTPHSLIREILLKSQDLTEEEVETFQKRPMEEVARELVIQRPVSRGDKRISCEKYLKKWEAAKGGFKALTDNAILKAWEFTLASLSEAKADFAKWNFFTSLGVQVEEPHGIGESLFRTLQTLVDRYREDVEAAQSRFDHMSAQLKYLEGRMRRASSESEAGWLRADYQMRRHEVNRVVVEGQEAEDKMRRLSQLYPFLIDFYGGKIRDYFQEVYDPQMHDVVAHPYDDSPAGFRLLYKHGRANPSLWTLIHSPSEYIQYLTAFFVSTEMDLAALPELEGLRREISELVATTIHTIKESEFLESSIHRLAKAYREPHVEDPLENLEKVNRKPWSYTSGGTMETLVSCYYGSGTKPKEEKKWIEKENELLAFWIEILRAVPLSTQKLYEQDPNRSMLAFSPTHAFICKPGWSLFRKSWESDLYPYTWIRDVWLSGQEAFLEKQLLSGRMIHYLTERVLGFFPSSYRTLARAILPDFAPPMYPAEFRRRVLEVLVNQKWLQRGGLMQLADEIDSLFYRLLPLFPEHDLRDHFRRVLEQLSEIQKETKEEMFRLFSPLEEEIGRYRMLSSLDLRRIIKGLYIQASNTTRSPVLSHDRILEVMRKEGLAFPEPFLVADTNWVNNAFGFTLNPGTRDLEFWRFDFSGS